MAQKIIVASLHSPRMVICGVSDDMIKSFWNLVLNLSERHLTWMQVKENMYYRSFFQSGIKREKGSICYSKSE